jgi:two-component system, sensor histidine kinase RegB
MKTFANGQRVAARANASAVSTSPSALNLRRLIVLRTIALAAQALAVWVAVQKFGMPLQVQPLVFILATFFIFNLLTWVRLQRSWPVSDMELFAHLVLDVVALTALLYFAGGSTNPFAPLYLLPLTLAAAALPWAYTWAMAALTVTCYSALLFFYFPLPSDHAPHSSDFQLHVVGMWLGFILSAGLIAYFAVRIRETLQDRERLRARMREQELRHERLLALGTFAAGAAHELGTPLSTIAVITNELARDTSPPRDKLQTLREQITRCKEILASLSAAAGQTRAEGGGAQALDAYLDGLTERWRRLRPAAGVHSHFEGRLPAPQIVSEHTLSQALVNVFNNAADASSPHVEIEGRWTDDELMLEVRDRGPGVAPAVLEHAGEPFFSTKSPGEGMGLGLFLARGTIERLGGSLELSNREGGGAICRVRLPLTMLRVNV